MTAGRKETQDQEAARLLILEEIADVAGDLIGAWHLFSSPLERFLRPLDAAVGRLVDLDAVRANNAEPCRVLDDHALTNSERDRVLSVLDVKPFIIS